MHVSTSEVCDASAAEHWANMFGPAQVDQIIRQAVQSCWMALPKDRRNADELERQLRRLVERALKDFREDAQAFASSPEPPKEGQS
jgi:hypothetical protein